jgi:hypothetical protein
VTLEFKNCVSVSTGLDGRWEADGTWALFVPPVPLLRFRYGDIGWEYRTFAVPLEVARYGVSAEGGTLVAHTPFDTWSREVKLDELDLNAVWMLADLIRMEVRESAKAVRLEVLAAIRKLFDDAFAARTDLAAPIDIEVTG